MTTPHKQWQADAENEAALATIDFHGHYSTGCCTLPDGHTGCCVWICNDCDGSDICPYCQGDSAEEDCGWCELCSGNGTCPNCTEGFTTNA